MRPATPRARQGHGSRALTRVGAAAVAAVVALGAGCSSSADDLDDVGATPVDRVLVVSLPGLDWETVEDADLPNLDRFVDDAAIADMSTRIGRRNATPTDAYLTIGAGTRAVAPVVDTAVAVEPDETYGGVPSAELLARRLGEVPDGIAYLGIGAAIDANVESAFGAEVGTLGDHLAAAGIDRAVIGNADAAEEVASEDPLPDGAYGRGAATMLMGSDGIVPDGAVSRSLLTHDPAAAFGQRLDRTEVVDAFDAAWPDDATSDRSGDESGETGEPGDPGDERAVVLVEASDLSRVTAYGGRATGAQLRALRDRAMAEADSLLGDLLERTDPERDAVIVLSPISRSASPALGIVGLRAPGVDRGLLQSATTRRDGYVQLADVTPTILTLLGLGEDTLDGMEGRSFQVGSRDGGTERARRLAEAADAAAFRDATMVLAVTVVSTSLALLALATALRRRLPAGLRALLLPLAFSALGLVPASFLVGRIGAVRANLIAQLAVVVAIAAVFGLAAHVVERRWPGVGALVAVGWIVALIVLDIALGAPLQLNTIFGYSVGVAGRFTGLGNLAFALFGSATIVLAALFADRGGGRGLRAALALMAAVVAVEGLPMLGGDVGGVLAMVPAFGVTALVLLGRPVGWREVVGLVATTVVVLLAFALVDSVRPPEVQTHLARFADNVFDARWETLSKNLGRRWQASLGGADLAGWITIGAAMLLAGAYAVAVAMGRAGPRATRPLRHRPTLAAAAGLGVLATLGLVANDSSVAVPLTMLIVIGPAAMLQVLAPGRHRPDAYGEPGRPIASNGRMSQAARTGSYTRPMPSSVGQP